MSFESRKTKSGRIFSPFMGVVRDLTAVFETAWDNYASTPILDADEEHDPSLPVAALKDLHGVDTVVPKSAALSEHADIEDQGFKTLVRIKVGGHSSFRKTSTRRNTSPPPSLCMPQPQLAGPSFLRRSLSPLSPLSRPSSPLLWSTSRSPPPNRKRAREISKVEKRAAKKARHRSPSPSPLPKTKPLGSGKNAKANHRRNRRNKGDVSKLGTKPTTHAKHKAFNNLGPGLLTGSSPHDYPMARGAYINNTVTPTYANRALPTVSLFALGFSLLEWDGCTTRPLIDRHERVFGLLAGRAVQGAEWDAVTERATAAVEKERGRVNWGPQHEDVKRKSKKALKTGISMGGGALEPHQFAQKEETGRRAMERLKQNEDLNRFANFAEQQFSMFAPKLYSHYHKCLSTVFSKLPHLKKVRNSAVNIWPAWSINFGPQVCCGKHLDVANLPYGWCAICALGDYDPTQGGHLVLWELKVVIEFPPGSVILIPSASITHSNTPIPDGQSRLSFTMYCSGSLFRWVDNGGRTDTDFEKEDPIGWAKHYKDRAKRNIQVMDYFSTLDELVGEDSKK